jgi:hypothetical protein
MNKFFYSLIMTDPEIREPGYRLSTSRKTEESELESRYGQEFYRLHVVETGSEAHPAYYPIGTGGSFPAGKVAGA